MLPLPDLGINQESVVMDIGMTDSELEFLKQAVPKEEVAIEDLPTLRVSKSDEVISQTESNFFTSSDVNKSD